MGIRFCRRKSGNVCGTFCRVLSFLCSDARIALLQHPFNWKTQGFSISSVLFLIVSVRKVKIYIGNDESHLRELTKWDEELLDSESVIYCGVEGLPSPNYTVSLENRHEKVKPLSRDYFPYWENDDNTRWSALTALEVEWGSEFNLTCVASLGNESISATIHLPSSKQCFYSMNDLDSDFIPIHIDENRNLLPTRSECVAAQVAVRCVRHCAASPSLLAHLLRSTPASLPQSSSTQRGSFLADLSSLFPL